MGLLRGMVHLDFIFRQFFDGGVESSYTAGTIIKFRGLGKNRSYHDPYTPSAAPLLVGNENHRNIDCSHKREYLDTPAPFPFFLGGGGNRTLFSWPEQLAGLKKIGTI